MIEFNVSGLCDPKDENRKMYFGDWSKNIKGNWHGITVDPQISFWCKLKLFFYRYYLKFIKLTKKLF